VVVLKEGAGATGALEVTVWAMVRRVAVRATAVMAKEEAVMAVAAVMAMEEAVMVVAEVGRRAAVRVDVGVATEAQAASVAAVRAKEVPPAGALRVMRARLVAMAGGMVDA